MKIKENWDKLILDHYNRLTDKDIETIYDIPTEKLEYLMLFDYKNIAAPSVREKLIKGLSVNQIKRTIKLTYDEIRGIGRTVNTNK